MAKIVNLAKQVLRNSSVAVAALVTLNDRHSSPGNEARMHSELRPRSLVILSSVGLNYMCRASLISNAELLVA